MFRRHPQYKLIFALLWTLVILLWTGPAFAADMLFPIGDMTGQPSVNRKCIFTPLDVDMTTLGIGNADKRTLLTDSTGSIVISNMAPGKYSMEITAPPAKKMIYFEAPLDGDLLNPGGLENVTNWVDSFDTVPSAGVQKIIAGDNITITPPSGVGRVRISSTGGGGNGGSATNAYQSQSASPGLVITTNLATFVYTLALNTALQGWSSVLPTAYSNGFYALLSSSNSVLQLQFANSNATYQTQIQSSNTTYQTQFQNSNTTYQTQLAASNSVYRAQLAPTNVATASVAGIVKVDNSSITVAADGTISAVTGGGGNVSGQTPTVTGNFPSYVNATTITNSGLGPVDITSKAPTNSPQIRTPTFFGALLTTNGQLWVNSELRTNSQYFTNSAILAGRYNTMIASNQPVLGSVIVGGVSNIIGETMDDLVDGITNSVNWSAIGGGKNNSIAGNYDVIGGGQGNLILFDFANLIPDWSFIGGGQNNTNHGSPWSVIVGGQGNYLDDGFEGQFIGGGRGNNTFSGGGQDMVIVGGYHNYLSGIDWGTIGGGLTNGIVGVNAVETPPFGATISGGVGNLVGQFVGGPLPNRLSGATVPGGINNVAGGYGAFAAGVGSMATNDGVFVFSDSLGGGRSTGSNQFVVKANGGLILQGTGSFQGNGSGLTNLTHSSTVSGVSGVSVALTQNPDGSTNYGLTVMAGGSGTVTSVGLSAPAEFTISGSPVNSSGTLGFTRTAGAVANYVGQTLSNAASLFLTSSLVVSGTVTVTNGSVIDLSFANGQHLTTNTAAPFNWCFRDTNGVTTWGTNNVTKVQMKLNGDITLPQVNGGTVTAQSGIFSQSLTAGGFANDINGNLSLAGSFTNAGTFNNTGNGTNFGAFYALGGLYSYGVPALTGASNLDSTKLTGTIPLGTLPASTITNDYKSDLTVHSFILDQWVMRTNPVDHSIVRSNTIYGGWDSLSTNGIYSINGVPLLSASALKTNAVVTTDSGTNLQSVANSFGVLQNNGNGTALNFTNRPALDLGLSTNVNTFDSLTNTFSGTALMLQTNQVITCSSNIYLITLGNLPPTGIERYGQLTIRATGTITVTNSITGWQTSDMVSTRTLTNGNTMVIAADVILGVATNLAIVQFH